MVIVHPTQEQVDAVTVKLLDYLSGTPYACTSLAQLSTRPANFVYRGELIKPVANQDGTTSTTVIVKHATDEFDRRRHAFEQTLFKALANFSGPPPSTLTAVATKSCPRLYLYELEPLFVQVCEDFGHTATVKQTIFSPNADVLLPQPDTPALLGRHLGSWLRAFHMWASAPSQKYLRAEVLPDDPERLRKRTITYADFVMLLDHFPGTIDNEKQRETLEEVSRVFGAEFEQRPIVEGGDESWGIIHADTWTGNFLLPTKGWQASPLPSDPNKLFIIDWEYAQWGHRSIDLGQLVGDLLERIFYNKVDISLPVVKGIIQGYGKVSDEMAFRTAIHAGVHIIRGSKRRPKTGPWALADDGYVEGLKVARDWVLKGWAKDKEYFRGTYLEGLFITE